MKSDTASGGQAATARAVAVGSADAMLAARDADMPSVNSSQVRWPGRLPARESASSTETAATTAPSMETGSSQDVNGVSPARIATVRTWEKLMTAAVIATTKTPNAAVRAARVSELAMAGRHLPSVFPRCV
jgi:hypothetical protein